MSKKKVTKRVVRKPIKKAKRILKKTTKRKVVRRPKSSISAPPGIVLPPEEFDIESFRMKGPIPQEFTPAGEAAQDKANAEKLASVVEQETATEVVRAKLTDEATPYEEAPYEDAPDAFEEDELADDETYDEGDPID